MSEGAQPIACSTVWHACWRRMLEREKSTCTTVGGRQVSCCAYCVPRGAGTLGAGSTARHGRAGQPRRQPGPAAHAFLGHGHGHRRWHSVTEPGPPVGCTSTMHRTGPLAMHPSVHLQGGMQYPPAGWHAVSPPLCYSCHVSRRAHRPHAPQMCRLCWCTTILKAGTLETFSRVGAHAL